MITKMTILRYNDGDHRSTYYFIRDDDEMKAVRPGNRLRTVYAREVIASTGNHRSREVIEHGKSLSTSSHRAREIIEHETSSSTRSHRAREVIEHEKSASKGRTSHQLTHHLLSHCDINRLILLNLFVFFRL